MEQQGSSVRYWLSGGLLFASVPLMALALMVTSHGFEGVADAWNEAGWGAYVVVLLNLLLAPVAVVFMGLSAKRPAFHPATLALVSLPLLVVTGIMQHEASVVLEVVLSAAPADQLTIIAGSAGERLHLTQFALLAAGFGCALFGVASVMTLSRAELKLRVGLAAIGVALGLSALVLAFHTTQIINTFRAVAHVSPADRGTILGMGLLESEPLYVMGMALLLAGLVLCIATGVLTFPAQRTAAVAVFIFGLGAAVSLGLAELVARRSAFALPENLPSWVGTDLLEARAGGWSSGDEVHVEPAWGAQELDDALEENAGRWRNSESHRVCVAATKELTPAQLTAVLRFAAAKNLTVEFAARGAPQPVQSPAYARRFLEALAETVYALPVEAGAKCESCAGTATLQGDALDVAFTDGKKEVWTFDADGARERSDERGQRAIALSSPPASIGQLLDVATIAWSHGAHLFITVPEE